ncbi:hypothetical protein [Chondromyces apiculatus]|nr:hypothetical protein [Chondromyces apiculatus]
MTRASNSLPRLADACLSTSCLTILAVLVGLGAAGCGASHAAAPMARGADNAPTEGATLVQFEARSGETWSLRRADDSVVCRLPCRYWVRPSSDLTVRLDRYDMAEYTNTTYIVPAYLPANQDEVVNISVDRTHGLGSVGKYVAAPTGAIFSLMGGGFLGISIAALATGSKNITTNVEGSVNVADGDTGSVGVKAGSSTEGVAASVSGIAIGTVALTLGVLCWVWFAHDKEGTLEIDVAPGSPAPPPRARVRILPTGVAVETESTRGVITPVGAHFTF